jgi:hypothetical protein
MQLTLIQKGSSSVGFVATVGWHGRASLSRDSVMAMSLFGHPGIMRSNDTAIGDAAAGSHRHVAGARRRPSG